MARVVVEARCALGVQIGAQVITSFKVGQKGITSLELHPSGVIAKHQSGAVVLVPFQNLSSVAFEPEQTAKA